jgi:hypothetical protein
LFFTDKLCAENAFRATTKKYMFHIFGNVNCTIKLYQRRNNITIHGYLTTQEELGSCKN